MMRKRILTIFLKLLWFGFLLLFFVMAVGVHYMYFSEKYGYDPTPQLAQDFIFISGFVLAVFTVANFLWAFLSWRRTSRVYRHRHKITALFPCLILMSAISFVIDDWPTKTFVTSVLQEDFAAYKKTAYQIDHDARMGGEGCLYDAHDPGITSCVAKPFNDPRLETIRQIAKMGQYFALLPGTIVIRISGAIYIVIRMGIFRKKSNRFGAS